MSLASSMVLVVVIGLITYSARALPILVLADRPLPDWAGRALRNVGPAVLAALVVSFLAGGRGTAGIEAVELAAVIVAAAVAARTRKPLWSLGAGMVVLWVLLLVG